MADLINPKAHTQHTQLPDWLMERTELTVGAKLTYAKLARLYDPQRRCAYPSLETLAAWLHVNVRQARRYVKELEDAGLVQTHRPGLGESNRYTFLDHPWRREQAAPPVDLPPDTGVRSRLTPMSDQSGHLLPISPDTGSRSEATRLSDPPCSGCPPKIQGLRDNAEETTTSRLSAVLLDHCAPPPQQVGGRGGAGLAGIFRLAFGRNPTPAQVRMLVQWDEQSGTAGMPDLVDRVIGYTAERGKDAGYLKAVFQGCLTRHEYPDAPRPLRPGHGQSNRRAKPDTTYTDEWAREQNRIQMERLQAAMAARAVGG